MDEHMPSSNAATVIIGQRVRQGSERDFETWQRDMNSEAAKYPGFIGAEVNPPTAVQPDWIVIYRFDSVAHVQAWINSSTRQTWLAKGEPYVAGPGTQQVIGGGARATDPLEAAMDRLGLVELVGPDHFHGTVTSAVESVAGHDPEG